MKRNMIVPGMLLLLLVFLCACGGAADTAPAAAETALPAPEPVPSTAAPIPTLPPREKHELPPSPVRLSEVMARNHSTLSGPDGSFPDWIELVNPDGEPASLAGLILSDREDPAKGCRLPEGMLQPGEFLLVYADGQQAGGEELHVDFSLSAGESLYLFSPDGLLLDRMDLGEPEADCSLQRQGDETVLSVFPSPGYENSPAGFDAFQAALRCPSPLQIWEVLVSSHGPDYSDQDFHSDWVELKNTGDTPLSTEGWALSDDRKEPEKFLLPQRSLQPGERMLILCGQEALSGCPLSGFSLNSSRESLYLSRDGQILDFVSLHDIPCGGSYGRAEGENGFFYYAAPSFDGPNEGPRARRISQSPAAAGPDGVFEGADAVQVVLSGLGEIHYTLDGSLPTERSPVYTEPLTVERTCVLRAVAVQEGALPSPALNLSYILNEGHSLPVISLMGNAPLVKLVDYGITHVEQPGAVCFYENGQRAFSLGCGVSISGLTSPAVFPKRNLKVNLRGAYGAAELGYDLFDSGWPEMNSFILRAGQDSSYRMMNSEIWQELCLQMSDRVLTQHSKYCIVYLNGQYYGIYVMKENISPAYYAHWAGVSRSSVLNTVPHSTDTEDYMQMYRFICSEDMRLEENYQQARRLLDVDSFIDWVILEGVCGNFDLFRNVRFFRSTESDTGYQLAFFDLDNTLRPDRYTWEALFYDHSKSGYYNTNAFRLLNSLLHNPDFRAAFLARYSQVYDTVLSNDSVLARIEACEEQILPELERDRKRWGYSASAWKSEIQKLKDRIRETDWQNYCVERLDTFLGFTDAEWETYFPELRNSG